MTTRERAWQAFTAVFFTLVSAWDWRVHCDQGFDPVARALTGMGAVVCGVAALQSCFRLARGRR